MIPPQCGQWGSSSPLSTRPNTSSVGQCAGQTRQRTDQTLPCTSTVSSSGRPAAWWRPSMFWVTQPSRRPMRANSVTALWAGLGRAWRRGEVDHLAQLRFRAPDEDRYRSMVKSSGSTLVHRPSGPRKSGIPDSVDTPAPVKIRIRVDPSSSAAACSMDSGMVVPMVGQPIPGRGESSRPMPQVPDGRGGEHDGLRPGPAYGGV